MYSEEESWVGQIAFNAELSEVGWYTTGEVSYVGIGEAVYEGTVVGLGVAAYYLVDEGEAIVLGVGFNNFGGCAFCCASQQYIHGVVQVVDGVDTGGVVVTDIFEKPSGVVGFAV